MSGDCEKDVFIFEEIHTSLEIQLKMALRLIRLRRYCDVKFIALEGALQQDGAIETRWYQAQSDPRKRAAVAVQLLKKGETSAAEFMDLIFPDIILHGIENANEYQVETVDGYETVIECLFYASLPSLKLELQKANNQNLQKLDALWLLIKWLADLPTRTGKGEKLLQALGLVFRKKWIEAREFVIQQNEAVWNLYERYKQLYERTDQALPLEAELNLLQEIKDSESFQLLIQINSLPDSQARSFETLLSKLRPHLEAFEKHLHFLQMASQRSTTMVDHTLNLLDHYQQASAVMIIGAGHTEKVIQLLEARGKSHLLIPLRILSTKASVRLSYSQYERKLRGQSVDELGELGALLDGRTLKPPPVIPKPWLQAKAEINVALTEMVAAVASGASPPFNRPPYNLWDVFDQFQWITIQRDSLYLDQGEVIGTITVNLRDGSPAREIGFRATSDPDDRLSDLITDVDYTGQAIEHAIEQALLTEIEKLATEGEELATEDEGLSALADQLEQLTEAKTADEIAAKTFITELEQVLEPETRIQADELLEQAERMQVMALAPGVLAKVTPNPEAGIPPIRAMQ